MNITEKATEMFPGNNELQDAYIKGISFVKDNVKHILANTNGDAIFLKSNINAFFNSLEENSVKNVTQSNIWHSVDDVPEKYKMIFCCIEPDVKYLTLNAPNRDKWTDYVRNYKIKRWSYKNIMYSI